MRYLLGIDDTDDRVSRGTGYRVRQLADHLVRVELARPLSITRHQLFVSPEIPYTSHNSSACMLLECDSGQTETLWESAGEFLARVSASGADAGLGLADQAGVRHEAESFGRRAKRAVLTQAEAQGVASESNIRLIGLTGTGGGIIGALAAIGLRASGEDGRFLWLPGLRELQGKRPAAEIRATGHVDRICTLNGQDLYPETLIEVGEWARPVLRGGLATLYVEEHNHEWHILSKDRIKDLSS